MDLATGSTAFASIVGLIGQYLDQKRATSGQTFEEFQAWLAENRHGEVIRLLEQNADTVVSIKALLALDRAYIQEQLASLDRTLALMANTMSQFVGLARSIRPEINISDHAMQFLTDFDASGAGKLLEAHFQDGLVLVAMDGPTSREIRYGDPRFYEDDLRQLIEAQLIRTGMNSQGKRVLHFTREASSLVRQASKGQSS